jgi:cobalt/nickel transport system permease protein
MSWGAREQQFLRIIHARGLKPVGRNHVDRTLGRIARFFSRSMLREDTAGRAGLLQRVDPRARLLSVLLLLVSVSLARSIPALMIHAALPLLAGALSRIRPKEFLCAGLLWLLLFSTLMAAPATLNLFAGGQVIVPLAARGEEWRCGPYALPRIIGITREGLLGAATFLLRVTTSGAAILWLTLSTRWADLLRALRCLRLPAVFLQVTGMTVRFIHAFHRQSEEILLGKKSRTVCRPPVASEQAWVGSRIAQAWERSLQLMQEVNDAMTARGFRGEVRFPPGTAFRGPEWALLAVVVVTCLWAHWVWGAG